MFTVYHFHIILLFPGSKWMRFNREVMNWLSAVYKKLLLWRELTRAAPSALTHLPRNMKRLEKDEDRCCSSSRDGRMCHLWQLGKIVWILKVIFHINFSGKQADMRRCTHMADWGSVSICDIFGSGGVMGDGDLPSGLEVKRNFSSL